MRSMHNPGSSIVRSDRKSKKYVRSMKEINLSSSEKSSQDIQRNMHGQQSLKNEEPEVPLEELKLIKAQRDVDTSQLQEFIKNCSFYKGTILKNLCFTTTRICSHQVLQFFTFCLDILANAYLLSQQAKQLSHFAYSKHNTNHNTLSQPKIARKQLLSIDDLHNIYPSSIPLNIRVLVSVGLFLNLLRNILRQSRTWSTRCALLHLCFAAAILMDIVALNNLISSTTNRRLEYLIAQASNPSRYLGSSTNTPPPSSSSFSAYGNNYNHSHSSFEFSQAFLPAVFLIFRLVLLCMSFKEIYCLLCRQPISSDTDEQDNCSVQGSEILQSQPHRQAVLKFLREIDFKDEGKTNKEDLIAVHQSPATTNSIDTTKELDKDLKIPQDTQKFKKKKKHEQLSVLEKQPLIAARLSIPEKNISSPSSKSPNQKNKPASAPLTQHSEILTTEGTHDPKQTTISYAPSTTTLIQKIPLIRQKMKEINANSEKVLCAPASANIEQTQQQQLYPIRASNRQFKANNNTGNSFIRSGKYEKECKRGDIVQEDIQSSIQMQTNANGNSREDLIESESIAVASATEKQQQLPQHNAQESLVLSSDELKQNKFDQQEGNSKSLQNGTAQLKNLISRNGPKFEKRVVDNSQNRLDTRSQLNREDSKHNQQRNNHFSMNSTKKNDNQLGVLQTPSNKITRRNNSNNKNKTEEYVFFPKNSIQTGQGNENKITGRVAEDKGKETTKQLENQRDQMIKCNAQIASSNTQFSLLAMQDDPQDQLKESDQSLISDKKEDADIKHNSEGIQVKQNIEQQLQGYPKIEISLISSPQISPVDRAKPLQQFGIITETINSKPFSIRIIPASDDDDKPTESSARSILSNIEPSNKLKKQLDQAGNYPQQSEQSDGWSLQRIENNNTNNNFSSSEYSLSSSFFNEDTSANPDADYLTNPLLEKLSRPFRYPRLSSNESLSNGDHSVKEETIRNRKSTCKNSEEVVSDQEKEQVTSHGEDWKISSGEEDNEDFNHAGIVMPLQMQFVGDQMGSPQEFVTQEEGQISQAISNHEGRLTQQEEDLKAQQLGEGFAENKNNKIQQQKVQNGVEIDILAKSGMVGIINLNSASQFHSLFEALCQSLSIMDSTEIIETKLLVLSCMINQAKSSNQSDLSNNLQAILSYLSMEYALTLASQELSPPELETFENLLSRNENKSAGQINSPSTSSFLAQSPLNLSNHQNILEADRRNCYQFALPPGIHMASNTLHPNSVPIFPLRAHSFDDNRQDFQYLERKQSGQFLNIPIQQQYHQNHNNNHVKQYPNSNNFFESFRSSYSPVLLSCEEQQQQHQQQQPIFFLNSQHPSQCSNQNMLRNNSNGYNSRNQRIISNQIINNPIHEVSDYSQTQFANQYQQQQQQHLLHHPRASLPNRQPILPLMQLKNSKNFMNAADSSKTNAESFQLSSPANLHGFRKSSECLNSTTSSPNTQFVGQAMWLRSLQNTPYLLDSQTPQKELSQSNGTINPDNGNMNQLNPNTNSKTNASNLFTSQLFSNQLLSQLASLGQPTK